MLGKDFVSAFGQLLVWVPFLLSEWGFVVYWELET